MVHNVKFLKCHYVVTSEVLVAVELVGKGRVEKKSFRQDLITVNAFENCLR